MEKEKQDCMLKVAIIILIVLLIIVFPKFNVIHDDFKEFKSVTELKMFLAFDNTDENEYINDTFDCDDFAIMLIENARERGYKIYGYGDYTDNHMYCVTKINGLWYFIEPQTDYVYYKGIKEI